MVNNIIEDGLIVAYPLGCSFSAEDLKKLHPNLLTFAFSYEPFEADAEILVRATSLENALNALGYGNAYEEEWGDFRGLLEAIRTGEAEAYLRTVTTYTEVDVRRYRGEPWKTDEEG
jgi:hypothetical protein